MNRLSTKAARLAARWIPEGSNKITSKRSALVVYLHRTAKGVAAAVGYLGDSAKPAFHYSFRDNAVFKGEHLRANFVRERFAAADAAAADKAARKATNKAAADKGHGLKVGDVLVSSWGYDQTNIDFYEVTRLAGKATLGLRRIASETVDTAYMQGKCVPVPGAYTGPETTHRAQVSSYGVHVKVSSCANAYPAERIVSASGAFIGYKPHHFTAYA